MENLINCLKCGKPAFHVVWMSTLPQKCSHCGYEQETFKITC